MTPDLKEINAYICKLYKHFLKKNISKSDSEWDSFLNSIVLTLKGLTYVKMKLPKNT